MILKMKVLYVKDKGYYVEGHGDYWSTWTNKITEATIYEEPIATNLAVTRSDITGHNYEVKEAPFSEEELEALRHRKPEQIIDLLMSGMFK